MALFKTAENVIFVFFVPIAVCPIYSCYVIKICISKYWLSGCFVRRLSITCGFHNCILRSFDLVRQHLAFALWTHCTCMYVYNYCLK